VALGPRWGTDGTDEEIARGREIFVGSRRLQRGGAPCFSCHSVRGEGWMGGGTLGPDLTFSYARIGEKGMGPVLAAMGGAPAEAQESPVRAPVMRGVYGGAPLEEDEQFAVKAYLASLARDGTVSRKDRDFFPLGLEGMGIVLGAFALRRRRPLKPTQDDRSSQKDRKGGAS